MVAWSSPQTGGTRGGAKDAPERVKAQAIIIFWKKMARGAGKMVAYAFAGKKTNNSQQSVRAWVKLEEDLGLDALESKRENCGVMTRFSPSKKRRIDTLMEECDGEPTERQVQEALGLGSHQTAGVYIKQAGYCVLARRVLQHTHAQVMLDIEINSSNFEVEVVGAARQGNWREQLQATRLQKLYAQELLQATCPLSRYKRDLTDDAKRLLRRAGPVRSRSPCSAPSPRRTWWSWTFVAAGPRRARPSWFSRACACAAV